MYVDIRIYPMKFTAYMASAALDDAGSEGRQEGLPHIARIDLGVEPVAVRCS